MYSSLRSVDAMLGCSMEDFVPKKQCMFDDIGTPCRDHVSQYICNEHAKPFGIIYKTETLSNDINKIKQTVIYLREHANLNIPLFMSNNFVYDNNLIKSFVDSVAQERSIKRDKFYNALACKLTPVASAGNLKIGGWLDESANFSIIMESTSANNPIQYINDLPILHKLLLCYAKPSIVLNTDNSSEMYIPNVSLAGDGNVLSSNAFRFIVRDKDHVLRWTNDADCKATPLIINAIYKNSTGQQTLCYKPVSSGASYMSTVV